MENVLDDEGKKQMLKKASAISKVPLRQLDRLIKLRSMYAFEKNVDDVERLNKEIRQLLGL